MLITKLKTKNDYVMKCWAQMGNLTTNLKVKIDYTLPEFRAKLL